MIYFWYITVQLCISVKKTCLHDHIHIVHVILIKSSETETYKTNKMTCASSEDSYQPRYPHVLIIVFAVRLKVWVLSYQSNAQQLMRPGKLLHKFSRHTGHLVGFVMHRLIFALLSSNEFPVFDTNFVVKLVQLFLMPP